MILFHCEHDSIYLDNLSAIPLRDYQTIAIIGIQKSVHEPSWAKTYTWRYLNCCLIVYILNITLKSVHKIFS